MRLDQTRPGQSFLITRISDRFARIQALRFGICEGACATCQAVLPGGPVVVRKGLQELAMGRTLCRAIEVKGLEG